MCVACCPKAGINRGILCFLGLQSAGVRGKKSLEAQPLQCWYESTYTPVLRAPYRTIDG